MRSDTVVLPASMCAMTPISRTLSIGYLRAILCSPAGKVGEGAVSLGHPVHVELLLDSGALVLIGEDYFFGQFDTHGFSLLGARCGNEPPGGQYKSPFGPHLFGYLVVGASDPAGNGFDLRRDIFDRLQENFQRLGFHNPLYLIKRAVHNLLGRYLLSAGHQVINKTGNGNIAVNYIRLVVPFILSLLSHRS